MPLWYTLSQSSMCRSLSGCSSRLDVVDVVDVVDVDVLDVDVLDEREQIDMEECVDRRQVRSVRG
jgi:hypothetical protein